MKTLSLTQPWASLVAVGEKRFETRSWPTRYRGLLAIHAAKNFPAWARDLSLTSTPFVDALFENGVNPVWGLPQGAIVGVVELLDCLPTGAVLDQISTRELVFGDFSPGRYAWKLGDGVRFAEPIPCRGALGLWDTPADVEAEIRRLALLPASK